MSPRIANLTNLHQMEISPLLIAFGLTQRNPLEGLPNLPWKCRGREKVRDLWKIRACVAIEFLPNGKKVWNLCYLVTSLYGSFGNFYRIFIMERYDFAREGSRFGVDPRIAFNVQCLLVQSQQYEEVAKLISRSLTAMGISAKIDVTGTSIGKRYARTHELGVPFAITVDSANSIIICERDSKEQVRVDLDKVGAV